MKCPRCGLINVETAERCDCGHSFVDSSFAPPSPQPVAGAERLRRMGCAIALAAFAAAMLVRIVAADRPGSFWLLIRASGDLFMLIAAGGFIAWVIATLRLRRG